MYFTSFIPTKQSLKNYNLQLVLEVTPPHGLFQVNNPINGHLRATLDFFLFSFFRNAKTPSDSLVLPKHLVHFGLCIQPKERARNPFMCRRITESQPRRVFLHHPSLKCLIYNTLPHYMDRPIKVHSDHILQMAHPERLKSAICNLMQLIQLKLA